MTVRVPAQRRLPLPPQLCGSDARMVDVRRRAARAPVSEGAVATSPGATWVGRRSNAWIPLKHGAAARDLQRLAR